MMCGRVISHNHWYEINYTKLSTRKFFMKRSKKKLAVISGCARRVQDFSPSSPTLTLIYFLTFKWTNFLLLLTIIISAILGRITQQNTPFPPFHLMEDEKCHRRKKETTTRRHREVTVQLMMINFTPSQHCDLYLIRCLMKEWNFMGKNIL